MPTPQIQQIIANAEAGEPTAQFLLSQICMQQQDIAGMFRWVTAASSSGLPDATAALGHCYEKGQGVASDMTVALAHYDNAVKAGSKIAAFHKAQLLHKSRSGIDQSELIRDLLLCAANAGIIPAVRTVAYLAMQRESSRALALECLHLAASRGDPVSSFNLGWCLLEGWGGEESRTEAGHWLQQAVKSNYPLAADLLASVDGPQSVPQPAAPDARIKNHENFRLYPEETDVEHEVMSEDPPIKFFDEVLNVADRAYLMFHSRPHLKRASVIDPDGDSKGMVSKVRTSLSTYIPFELVDIISRYVELKIIGGVGEDLMRSEPMSILCYAPGEYYRPHFDFFNPKLTVSQEFMRDGGQRIASAITYLAAPIAGGGTSFPNLDITVPAAAGGTVWFRNCFEDGQVDERSLHAGDTVDAGEKWVVTKWFRERPTQYLQI